MYQLGELLVAVNLGGGLQDMPWPSRAITRSGRVRLRLILQGVPSNPAPGPFAKGLAGVKAIRVGHLQGHGQGFEQILAGLAALDA